MSESEFATLLRRRWPDLREEQYQQVIRFRDEVVSENQRQNLTKLILPLDFYEGHVEDVRILLECGLLEERFLDLGSGCGVPGLLAVLLSVRHSCVLAESEGAKAAFLGRTADALGVSSRASVFSGRAEAFLKSSGVSQVICRAVGPVDRIYSWLRPCSTWNNLLLFKGPRWMEEWESFSQSRYRGELRLEKTIDYRVGAEEKRRVLVLLRRVPRGTK